MAPTTLTECDSLLLLVAILSDAIHMERSLGNLSRLERRTASQQQQNQYHILSASRERRQMRDKLLLALTRWKQRYTHPGTGDELSLFFFCQLYLICPALSVLPRLADYTPAVSREILQTALDCAQDETVSDEAVGCAWDVLESASTGARTNTSLCPIWCPLVVFYAGLVVWARIRQNEGLGEKSRGTRKQLLAFKNELDQMSWPCCAEMASTLDRLVRVDTE
jgi:hypothetical protein